MQVRFVIALLLLIPVMTFADVTSSHYRILDPTIAPGGRSTSASYTLHGTAGEFAHSTSTSASYSLRLGFFNFPVVTAPVVTPEVGTLSGRVTLSWTAAVPYLGYQVTGYDIGKATISGGPYTYTSVGNVLVYDYNGLIDGTPYYFVVRALDQTSIPIATSSEVTATPVSPSLSFLIDSGNQSFPMLSPGSLVATSSYLYVKVNNATGFVTSMARTNVTGTMALVSNPSKVIPDKTDWYAPPATTTPGPTTASSTQQQALQFRIWKSFTDSPNYSTTWWGSDDTSSGALFAGIPSTTQTIANRSTPAPATTTIRVLYNVDVDPYQETGTYNGDITYSVSANL